MSLKGTPQFCDFSKVGLGRTLDISMISRAFDVADLRNHISKVRPINIIHNNYSNITKI